MLFPASSRATSFTSAPGSLTGWGRRLRGARRQVPIDLAEDQSEAVGELFASGSRSMIGSKRSRISR